MRKMATIRRIQEIKRIPDADRIVAYRIDGWWVVDGVDKYHVNAPVIFVELDAFVPNTLAPFLSKGHEPREYEDIRGEKLRSAKFRGQISQGLLLPLDAANIIQATDDIDGEYFVISMNNKRLIVYEGDDISQYLNIVKYEPPVPAELAGLVKGLFPGYIQKTDQTRIQSLTSEFEEWKRSGDVWVVEEKLDGSSLTCFVNDGEFGVCSRNLELKQTDSNTHWKVTIAQGIEESIRKTGKDYAFQFELIGEGIQGNPYKIKGHRAYLFDIYDIKNGKYLVPNDRFDIAQKVGIVHQVPVLEHNVLLSGDIDDLLQHAEGKSALNNATEREGLVYKNVNSDASFKVISNKFLIKTGG